MVQILPPQQDPLNQAIQGLKGVIPDALEKYQKNQEQKKRGAASSQFFGQDISGLDPQIQQLLVQEKVKQPFELQKKREEFGLKAQLEAYKASLPGKKSADSEPIDQEHDKKLDDIFEENPDISSTQFLRKADKAGIPRKVSKPYFDSINKEKEQSFKEKVQDNTISADYYKDLRESNQTATNQLSAIEDILDVVDPASNWTSIANWAKSFGEPGRILANAFQTAEQGQFQAALPNLLEGFRELFGVRITDADLKLLQDKLPDIGKDAETNRSILNILKSYSTAKKKKYEIANEITDRYGGYRPPQFESLVEKEFNDWSQDFRKYRQQKAFLEEPDKGFVYVMNPDGEIDRMVPINKIEELPPGYQVFE